MNCSIAQGWCARNIKKGRDYRTSAILMTCYLHLCHWHVIWDHKLHCMVYIFSINYTIIWLVRQCIQKEWCMQNIIILKCQHVRIACGHFDIILSTLLNILLIICQTVMDMYRFQLYISRNMNDLSVSKNLVATL